MKPSEIKKLIIESMDENNPPTAFLEKLEEEGITYDFAEGFTGKVTDRLYRAGLIVNGHIDFVRNLNLAFNRIAITGIAAIVLLLISIFIMEGSFSFNTFLGIGNSYDESIICLITGN